MTSSTPILYADDDENDLFFMERAFEQLKITNPLKTVDDGKKAIEYLAGHGPYANREQFPLPGLLLLDLSMPRKDGLEVLQWIRSQPTLTGLVVIVLTSSNQESDIHRAGILGANGYLVKPGDPDDLIRVVKGIQDYWLSGTPQNGRFVDFASVKAFARSSK